MRYIDSELTVIERLDAWRLAGGDEIEVSQTALQMALYLRTANFRSEKTVKQIDLDGIGLNTVVLTRYINLSKLLLRGNNMTTLNEIGLESMPKLVVFDARDNKLDMSRESLRDHVEALRNCKLLQYVGLLTFRLAPMFTPGG